MPSIGPRHAYNVIRLNKLFMARCGDQVEVRAQVPIRLANGAEPQPDIAVVTLDPADPKSYESRHPAPAETLLVLEVADTTVTFDLGEKAQMYALHGIAEYWVLDLMGHRIVTHRNPTPNGYTTVRSLESGASIIPLAFPDVTFTADEILG